MSRKLDGIVDLELWEPMPPAEVAGALTADFEAALPHLDAAERAGLIAALERCHPGHRWLTRLAD